MYKDLLVEIDDSDACQKRIDFAIDIARRFDAHLTALYIVERFVPPPTIGLYITSEMEARILEGESERTEKALDRFRRASTGTDVEFDVRVDKGEHQEHARILSTHARYADLLILGQPGPDDTVPSIDPGDVALGSGAPLIVTPHIGAPATTAEKVMVAWNAGRESARAVRDAIPLLERAKAVDVVCFKPKATASGHGDLPGADIALHLSRHGVKVDVQILQSDGIDVGNALLSLVADRGSDFLVMGCYGHSRLREAVMGGATRTILQSMTVPVLMAH